MSSGSRKAVENCLEAVVTVTYDPSDAVYFDEADVRGELTRVFSACHGCQACVRYCGVFPTLFQMIDRQDDRDAGRLTPFQQDHIVDECFHCKLCVAACPYTPELHELQIDFPRLMLRARAMQRRNHQRSSGRRFTDQVQGRTDLVGSLATSMPRLANRLIGGPTNSRVRRAVAHLTGLSASRPLPPYAKQRFSTWFRMHVSPKEPQPRRRAVVFPTCVVEYQQPGVGHDLIKVYERNAIDCTLTGAGCCGAPWLHAGNVKKFRKVAAANVATLANEVRDGRDIVVPQPACAYVLRYDYPITLGSSDAALVAEHTFDACEYVLTVNQSGLSKFGDVEPFPVTYYTGSHRSALDVGCPGSEMMVRAGAVVTRVGETIGNPDRWGALAGNEAVATWIADRLADQIRRGGGDDGALQASDSSPLHPLQVVARAYGMEAE